MSLKLTGSFPAPDIIPVAGVPSQSTGSEMLPSQLSDTPDVEKTEAVY